MVLYKINSLFIIVMAKPKYISKSLGILIKNDIIEVLNFYNNWAYFKYNNIDAYIPSYNLIQLSKDHDIKTLIFIKPIPLMNFLPQLKSNTITLAYN